MCRNHDVWSTKARWGQRRGRLGAVIVAAVEVSSRRHRIRRKNRAAASLSHALSRRLEAPSKVSRRARADATGWARPRRDARPWRTPEEWFRPLMGPMAHSRPDTRGFPTRRR